MKYIIYGVNRVAKDFMYVFDKLEVLYFVDTAPEVDRFMNRDVLSLEEALCDKDYDKIIVCDFDKTDKIDELTKRGLVHKEHYLLEEDFFTSLDEVQIPDDREFLVWGTGAMAKMFMEQGCPYPVTGFIDTYKKSDTFKDLAVWSPDSITDWKKYFVIIAVSKDAEIREALEARGLKEKEDYISYQKIIGLPSGLLRKTIFDQSYYDLECNTMLNHLEIFGGGDTRCCCTTFVMQNLDNVLEKNLDELWHSNIHKIMCLSTENRTYSFCEKSMCPLFVAKTSERIPLIDEPYKQMTESPEVVALGHDSSCNLCCSTCRKCVHFAKGRELETVNLVTQKIKEEYLANCKFLILAGDGEVFASQAYRSIYEDSNCNPRYIRILSNGTLFNKKNWESFAANKTGEIMLTVSIDAATKPTYENIRRNGNFDILKENMEFAASLRREGKLRYFRMNFVVQQENYQEMIPFVKWGEELGVDEVFFTKILNWGTYSEEAFSKISMMEPNGVEPKPELKKVLEDPAMQSEIVDLGTIRYTHKKDAIDVVDNYYMWELEKRGGSIFEEF